MIVSLVIIVGVSATCGSIASDEGKALQAARDFGFSEPKIKAEHVISPEFYGCSSSDSVGYEVEALNSEGKPVLLAVCGGYLKGYTVRLK